MELVKLTDNETKNLEDSSMPIENVTQFKEPYATILMDIQSWYHANGLTANDTHRKMIDKLSSLLGFKPNYNRIFEYKTSIWGFEWEGEKFIIYKSKRGTSILIHRKFRKDKLQNFLEELVEQLGSKDFIKNYMKEKK